MTALAWPPRRIAIFRALPVGAQQANMTFFVTSGTMTFTGTIPRGPPITVPISPTPLDTGFPAAPGHFSSQTIFGLRAPPGTNFEIQVVQLTH